MVDVIPIWHVVPDKVASWDEFGRPIHEKPYDEVGAMSRFESPTLAKIVKAAGGTVTLSLADFLDALVKDDPRPVGHKESI